MLITCCCELCSIPIVAFANLTLFALKITKNLVKLAKSSSLVQ